jgi:hypothetical protein
MTKDRLIKISFGIALLCLIIAVAIKMLHISSIIPFFWAGLIFSIVYTVVAIWELSASKRISSAEKIMWTVGFLFFNTITGILYFASRRRMITRNFKILNF